MRLTAATPLIQQIGLSHCREGAPSLEELLREVPSGKVRIPLEGLSPKADTSAIARALYNHAGRLQIAIPEKRAS